MPILPFLVEKLKKRKELASGRLPMPRNWFRDFIHERKYLGVSSAFCHLKNSCILRYTNIFIDK
jgi:hypothetical protein